MILMQFNNDPDQSTCLVIVIEADNFERMKKADPITLMPRLEGGFIEPVKYPQKLGIFIAFENEIDIGKCYELQNDPGALLRYLSRGYKFNALDGFKVSPAETLKNTPS